MPTYATVAALRTYAPALTTATLSDPEAAALLERAEPYIDLLVGPVAMLPSGRKLAPAVLTAVQAAALARATCAQAQLMRESPALFVADQRDYVGGPEFSVRGRLNLIAPGARVELAGHRLAGQTGTAAPAI